jgi:glycosyltransferase involved in cell wall biosynthesis
MEILELARWPVGGIRTYFRYVFGHPLFRDHFLTFVAPEGSVLPLLQQYLPENGFRFVAVKDSGTGLFIASARLLAGRSFSLVHSHGFTAGAIAAPLCRLFGVPHLMTAHDVFQPGQFSGLRGYIKRRVLGWLFRMVDVIHTVTEDGRGNMLEYFPSLDRDRIHIILHGIDVAEFGAAPAQDFRSSIERIGENDFLIGFFGRFMAQKGFRYLVEAMDTLVNHRQLPRRPVVLTFGDGGFSREEYAEIERRGLGGYFVKLPHTDDMPGAIKGVDLVAMPSLWEACGLLAMESLVAGTPIIGTHCIGLREVLADSPARVIPPADAGALADAIEHEMTSGRKQEFIEFAPQAAWRFALDRPVRELHDLYRVAAECND